MTQLMKHRMLVSGDRPEGSYAAATRTGCPDPLYVRLSTTTPCVTVLYSSYGPRDEAGL